MEILIAFIVGLLSGILSNQAVNIFAKYKMHYADKRSKAQIFEYQPENDDLIVINRWSLERPLRACNHKVLIDTNRPNQVIFRKELWEKEVEKQKKEKRHGNICFLKDYYIDHQETEFGKTFTMVITPCDYSEYMATHQYLMANPTIKDELKTMLIKDPKLYLQNALPSNITVNVVVISDSNFLAIKRSKSVDTAKNKWTVGPCETMTLSNMSPGSVEDIFTLSKRCLREELFLTELDYKEIFVSWFGILASSFRTHIVALVKISITEGEVIKRANNSHSIYEAEYFEWLPLERNIIKSFIENNSGILSDTKYDWISFAKLSLEEALRVKHVL